MSREDASIHDLGNSLTGDFDAGDLLLAIAFIVSYGSHRGLYKYVLDHQLISRNTFP